MGDQKRTARRSVVVPLYDCEAAYALMTVMKSMNPGPGKPGPGDEWKVPLGSMDEILAQDDETAETTHSDHKGLLHRLIHRG